MTKEQEEAIKYLEKQINYFKEQIKFIEAVDCDYYDEEYELYKNRVKQFELVLNMLKENSAEMHQKNTELAEKNAEIEKYKKLLADNLARNLNDSIKAKEKADTDLDDLNKGWQVELEKYKQLYNKALDDAVITAHDNMKKDKMIDLMAEHIVSSAIVDDTVCAIKCDCETDIEEDCTHEKMLICTKQYFERKVENGG